MCANQREAISPYPHSHHNPIISSFHIIKPHKEETTKSLLSPYHLHQSSIYYLQQTNQAKPFQVTMASINSSVLSCNYALSGSTAASDANLKLASMPLVNPVGKSYPKLPAIRAQKQVGYSDSTQGGGSEGRRAALLFLASALFATATANSAANAGVIEEYLEKSKANKELNDKKRLATSGANFARAYTVEFGICQFPQNFTGCQDLAKQKKVPFLTDDLELECRGKDKFKCGSNVFWKW